MSGEMTHEEARDMLGAAALDALSGEEQAEVLLHAATCPECGPALAALREATDQLAFAVPGAVDDPVRRANVRARLLARAHANAPAADVGATASDIAAVTATGVPVVDRTRAPRRSYETGTQPFRRGPGRPWIASPAAGWSVAGITGIAAILLLASLNSRTTAEKEELTLSRRADSLRIAQLEGAISTRDSTLRELTGQQVSILQLTSGAPRAPWAWMFWNHATNHWTFVAHNLPATPPGRTYQLWLVTPKAKISAGTFTPLADGSAQVQATYPLARDSLRAIAVTEEPAGGVLQPTGSFVLTVTAGQ
jgi:hypothetical protein